MELSPKPKVHDYVICERYMHRAPTDSPPWMITFCGKPLDLIIYTIIKKYMCGLKAAQKHERPFRAAKDHMQPLAALDSFLLNRKKILN